MIQDRINPHIKSLDGYVSARFEAVDGIFLDANENPYDDDQLLNRYPDPVHSELRKLAGARWDSDPNGIICCNGSDEGLDLIAKCFLKTGSSIWTVGPTYGYYRFIAQVFGAHYEEMPGSAMLKRLQTESPDMIILCHPNNPTGTLQQKDLIQTVLATGIPVIIDEAYGDFVPLHSQTGAIPSNDNLLILKTLSKAYGAAALRVGFILTNPGLADVLRKIKPPYNLSRNSLTTAVERLSAPADSFVTYINQTREHWLKQLNEFKFIHHVWPSVTNFILIESPQADALYEYCRNAGVILRRFSRLPGALRISIGTESEMNTFGQLLKEFHQ